MMHNQKIVNIIVLLVVLAMMYPVGEQTVTHFKDFSSPYIEHKPKHLAMGVMWLAVMVVLVSVAWKSGMKLRK
jgi:hypothetical protein